MQKHQVEMITTKLKRLLSLRERAVRVQVKRKAKPKIEGMLRALLKQRTATEFVRLQDWGYDGELQLELDPKAVRLVRGTLEIELSKITRAIVAEIEGVQRAISDLETELILAEPAQASRLVQRVRSISASIRRIGTAHGAQIGGEED